MKFAINVKSLLLVVCFAIVLALVVIVYTPGLKGGFLFDDYPNLEELGSYGGVVDLDTFKSFVFHGISSQLGRPLALATFLLDDNTWPSNAEWFKSTNLKIHLLTGLLLCWAALNLMRLFGRSESESVWVALLTSAIWLLHPYMVSTTLYVVQRMAQLAALFVFAGLAAYFRGRLLLASGKIIPAYIWMSCSIVLATLLALLSKENGILLPMMVMVIEVCLPKNTPKIWLWWRIAFLWVPAVAVLGMLTKEINFSPDAWPSRPFTQPERLLTEGRIIWEYLFHLYIPRIEGRGLFQDGYPFSRSFLSPPITLIALLALVALISVAIRFRHKYPLWSLGILFFLVSHLLESTVIGLELYFEHRNYLSSAFLFLPVADTLVSLHRRRKLWVPVVSAILLLNVLAFLTWQRATLWSNTEKLELYWAVATPESPRAQSKIGAAKLNMGDSDGAIKHMEQAVKTFPRSSLVTISLLLMKLHVNLATESDFVETAERMKNQPFDAQAVIGLRNLVANAIEHNGQRPYVEYTLNLLDTVQKNVSYSNVHSFKKLVPYLKAELYLVQEKYDLAFDSFSEAMPLHSDTDASFNMVAEMANASRPIEALLLLKQAEDICKLQADSSLKRPRLFYESEFKRFRSVLYDDMAALGITNINEVDNPPTGSEVNAKHSDSGKK
jgi:tetratricopeptide (TPR) repeat protein